MTDDHLRLAVLVIFKQPPPMVLLRKKSLSSDEEIELQVLTGTNVEIKCASEVRVVTVMMDKNQVKNTKDLECESKEMNHQFHTSFPIKFVNGTRKNLATLKFDLRVQSVRSPNHTVTLESEYSNPFVAITNEIQYEESDGLILKTLFSNQINIPWILLANHLQRHFIIGTRQDQINPKRCLSELELNYIHSSFFGGNSNVTSKQFDDFWAWFSKVLHKLRHQRTLSSMWQNGLIYGFTSKDVVNNILQNKTSGSFLVRFSENNPGQFALGYVDTGQRVHHYLIKEEETSGKKTLATFLHESQQISKIIQVRYETSNGTFNSRLLDKYLALESYVGKKPPEQKIDQSSLGYDTFMTM